MTESEDSELVSEGRDVVVPPVKAADPAGAGRLVVAAIGIDQYRYWPKLGNAVSDACGVVDLFRRLGSVELRPPLLDDDATGAAIAELTHDLDKLGASDSLIVFFAGHGGTRTQRVGERDVRTGYLIPVDAVNERASSWIELEPWLNQIARLPPRHILVILDACFSGIALSQIARWARANDAIDTLPFAAANTRQSRMVITSALDDQRALDRGPLPDHSLFTGCLIKALTGSLPPVGERDGRPVVVGSDLGYQVRRMVETFPELGWRQTPDLGRFTLDDRGEMLIPVLFEGALPEGPDVARGSARRIPMRAGEDADGDGISIERSIRELGARWRRGRTWAIGGIVIALAIAFVVLTMRGAAPPPSAIAAPIPHAEEPSAPLATGAPRVPDRAGPLPADPATPPAAGSSAGAASRSADAPPGSSDHANGATPPPSTSALRDPSTPAPPAVPSDPSGGPSPAPQGTARAPTTLRMSARSSSGAAGGSAAAGSKPGASSPSTTAPGNAGAALPPPSAVSGASKKGKSSAPYARPGADQAPICRTWVKSPAGAVVDLWDGRHLTIPVEIPFPCDIEVGVRVRKGTQEFLKTHTGKPGEPPIIWRLR